MRVEHASSTKDGEHIVVAYELNGKLYRTKGRAAIMAGGGAMARAVLADMPAEMHDAYGSFQHAPALVVNVALNNWNFLNKLGAACARWFDDELGHGTALTRRRGGKAYARARPVGMRRLHRWRTRPAPDK